MACGSCRTRARMGALPTGCKYIMGLCKSGGCNRLNVHDFGLVDPSLPIFQNLFLLLKLASTMVRTRLFQSI